MLFSLNHGHEIAFFDIKVKTRDYFLDVFATCKFRAMISKIAYLGALFSEHKIVNEYIQNKGSRTEP